MRIASLLPSATEILYSLGAGDEIVCVTHLCPQPEDNPKLVVSRSLFEGSSYTQEEIDTFLRMLGHQARGLLAIDEEKFAACTPDVTFIQGSCELCGSGQQADEVVMASIPGSPRLLMLQPHSLGEVMADIRRIGQAAGRAPEAETLLSDLRQRMMRLMRRAGAATRKGRRRVVLLEWVDPPMVGGLWLPELIDAAGGLPVLGAPQRPATQTPWKDIVAAQPEVLLIVPTGFSLARAAEEANLLTQRSEWETLPAVRSGEVYALDGERFFHGPTPALIDSLELLASVLHPQEFGEPEQADAVLRLG